VGVVLVILFVVLVRRTQGSWRKRVEKLLMPMVGVATVALEAWDLYGDYYSYRSFLERRDMRATACFRRVEAEDLRRICNTHARARGSFLRSRASACGSQDKDFGARPCRGLRGLPDGYTVGRSPCRVGELLTCGWMQVSSARTSSFAPRPSAWTFYQLAASHRRPPRRFSSAA
jgi:hypothetical protein